MADATAGAAIEMADGGDPTAGRFVASNDPVVPTGDSFVATAGMFIATAGAFVSTGRWSAAS